MFQVILMVCLAATGEQCKEFKLTKEYTDAVSCIRDSHGVGSVWQGENTKYTIIGTRCTKDTTKIPKAPNS
ncbi:MAG: hypothetical protein ACTSRM_00660 [Alphaproteobacteria bacterium]|jgi:hypothetical protein|uniref:hypothetical protein n=1 Tax=Methyloceanibacter sp. TaxID=1965321 RepID=UPI003569D0C9